MRFLDTLLRAEHKIQKRIDSVFGRGAARTPLEIRRAILDQVENSIVRDGRAKRFPFSRITVHFQPEGDHQRAILCAAFLEGKSLEQDIRDLLYHSGCQLHDSLEIALDFGDPHGAGSAVNSQDRFHLEFTRPAEPKPRSKKRHRLPEVEFEVLKGEAEQSVFRVAKTRIHLGRLKEVVDREGQIVRRNDVVFLDSGDEVNSTVGRAHAIVYFDEAKNEFRIVDELSKYGTRIFRESRSFEVPPGKPRGIRLRPGDEIYLGRACLRFGIPAV
jgi:FHA domain